MPYKDLNIRRIKARCYTKKQQVKRITFIQSFKDKPCMDCGIKYPPYVMDFDHRPSEKKLFCIGRVSYGPHKLAKEIAKCDVVCTNCHRERTYQRKNKCYVTH